MMTPICPRLLNMINDFVLLRFRARALEDLSAIEVIFIIIRRIDHEDITRMLLDKDISGRRHRGRPHRGRPRITWMVNIRRDVQTYGLDDQMTEDRKMWSNMVTMVDTRYSVQDPR